MRRGKWRDGKHMPLIALESWVKQRGGGVGNDDDREDKVTQTYFQAQS